MSIIKGCKKVYHSALRGFYQDANSLYEQCNYFRSLHLTNPFFPTSTLENTAALLDCLSLQCFSSDFSLLATISSCVHTCIYTPHWPGHWLHCEKEPSNVRHRQWLSSLFLNLLDALWKDFVYCWQEDNWVQVYLLLSVCQCRCVLFRCWVWFAIQRGCWAAPWILMTKNIKIQWPNALVMILRLCSWHRHTPNLDKVTKIHINCLIRIWLNQFCVFVITVYNVVSPEFQGVVSDLPHFSSLVIDVLRLSQVEWIKSIVPHVA